MLYTDYDNLALVYECSSVRIADGTCEDPRMLVLSRQPSFDDMFTPLVEKFAEMVCLKLEDFVDVSHDIGKNMDIYCMYLSKCTQWH